MIEIERLKNCTGNEKEYKEAVRILDLIKKTENTRSEIVVTKELETFIKNRYKEGMSYRKIGEILGISHVMIGRIVNEGKES